MMDPSNKKEDHLVENNFVNLEESYVIPSPTHDSVKDGSQESEEEDLTHDFIDDDEVFPSDVLKYTPKQLYQELSYQELSGSDDCISSDEWQELNKSDYAKVIFCDLYYHADSGGVGCKFQITDNVHEDPCDHVGLFRIGFESLTQCLISKMLSDTECEEDGKLLRCDFSADELPDIEAGFYQFLYITRDKEICGASMPIEIKRALPRDLSPDCVFTERGDDDFLLVRHSLEKKNQLLEELLAESQEKNRELNAAMETLTHEKDAIFKEKEVVIESLQRAMTALKEELASKVSAISETNNTVSTLSEQIPALNREISVKELLLSEKDNIIKNMSQQIDALLEKEREASRLHRENHSLSSEVQKLKGIHLSSYDQDQLTLLEQLDDQKFMIKALEDSKHLALKEMSDLSESLSKRTVAMNQLKHELNFCKTKIKDLTEALDKRTEELEDSSVELAAYKILKETPISVIQKTEDLLKVHAELAESQQKLNLSLNSESELTKEQEKLKNDLSVCNEQLEQSLSSENKLQRELEIEVEKNSSLEKELGLYQNEVNEFIKTRKIETALSNKRLTLIREVARQCKQLQEEMSPSYSKESGFSIPTLKQEICKRKCEILAYKGKITDITLFLKKAENCEQESLISEGSCRVNRKCLKKLENLENVELGDIAYINNLTERINHRESGCLLQVESIPESDINTSLKDAELCLKRVLIALRSRLWTSSDWSKLIDGYNKEYAVLPIEFQIELILAECRSQYEIEILLEHASSQQLVTDLKSKNSVFEREAQDLKVQLESIAAEKDAQISKLSDKLCDLQSKCMLLEEDIQDSRTHFGDLQSRLNESHFVCAKLKEECLKKDALIEFLKTEKGNLSSKQMQLQETVKEHTARLTEAAELYKKQFKEIEKLKKKLRKIKREPYQICASPESSDPPVVVLNDESKTSSPVHEIFYPARSSSDSDTGEHVSGDSALKETKERRIKENRTSRKQHIDARVKQFKAVLTRTKKCGTDSADFTGTARRPACNLNHENLQKFLFKLPQDPKLPSQLVEAAPEVELYPIPCPMCNREIHVSSKSAEALTNHLETQHHMSMCPICGHFFEESVPKKYLTYHIESHFRNTGKECKD